MANYLQRERSRSPRRRSRSPRRGRRSYSPRSRSRSRDDYRRNDRRSRSPVSGAAGAPGGHSASGYSGRNPSTRSYEDRSFAKEQMMQAVREPPPRTVGSMLGICPMMSSGITLKIL
ncbi:hypothetical protein PABG_11960 [Paracoccidioides brasiliensis Pb03]|nr:hypothetical protein PABG_11960 [Paracoccidioides brasiliensis Pb03]